MQGKTVVVVLVTLIIGFGAGFVLRPSISPIRLGVSPNAAIPAPMAPRGTQYFVAHINEARDVAADCRDGSVRGGECDTAEEAIIKVDAAERRKRFLGH